MKALVEHREQLYQDALFYHLLENGFSIYQAKRKLRKLFP
jgi:hypothetical protein